MERASAAGNRRRDRPLATPIRRLGSRVLVRRLLVLALLLTPLIAGEVAVRALIAMHRLPVAAAEAAALEVAWTNYERTGPTDILILGDSLARMGIHPDTLATHVSDAVGGQVTAYNLSTPGAGFPVYLAFVEELGDQGRLPKVAVIGISTVTLQRPKDRGTRALRSPLGRLISDCGDVRGLEETLSCRLESVSALWRWRGQSARVAGAFVATVPTTRFEDGIGLQPSGYGSGDPMEPAMLDHALAVALENTAPMARAEPDIRPYVDLITALRARGVGVVAVLMPYAPPFEQALEAREPAWRAMRSMLLTRLGERAEQPILDAGPIEAWWTIRDSHDMRHFSPRGARRFTTQLWEDPAIRAAILEGLVPASSAGVSPAAPGSD